jgi:hypothetical protein
MKLTTRLSQVLRLMRGTVSPFPHTFASFVHQVYKMNAQWGDHVISFSCFTFEINTSAEQVVAARLVFRSWSFRITAMTRVFKLRFRSFHQSL